MPLTYNQYTGDGSTKQYTLSFPYISKDHVFVRVDDASVPFTWLNDSTVVLDTAPEIGQSLSIFRATPRDEHLVTFKAGAGFREQDLNLMTTQVFYIVQESLENLDTAELYLWRTETLEAKNTAVDAAQQADAARATCIQERILTQDASQQTADDRRNTTAHVDATAAWAQLAMTAVDIPEWDVEISYSFPDTVLYTDGHTYRCISSVAQKGDVPGASTSWARITYDASNIVEEHGSYPFVQKDNVVLDGTLWASSRHGITWNNGYLSVFKTTTKIPLFPESLYLRREDPDIQGSLIIQGCAAVKHDRKRDRLNIFVSGGEARDCDDSPIYVDGDTCGAVTLASGVNLAVNADRELAVTVGPDANTEETPPETLEPGDLVYILSDRMITDKEFIEDDAVSFAAGESGVYAVEFVEDTTTPYFTIGSTCVSTQTLIEIEVA